jgi:hypothetical protein
MIKSNKIVTNPWLHSQENLANALTSFAITIKRREAKTKNSAKLHH